MTLQTVYVVHASTPSGDQIEVYRSQESALRAELDAARMILDRDLTPSEAMERDWWDLPEWDDRCSVNVEAIGVQP